MAILMAIRMNFFSKENIKVIKESKHIELVLDLFSVCSEALINRGKVGEVADHFVSFNLCF